MKSVDVKKKGMYYNPENKVTTHLNEEAYTLNDKFADLVVNEGGGDYAEKEVTVLVKDDTKGLDYSEYDLTNGALELAEQENVQYDFLDTVEGSGANGRITKDDLEDALLIALDGSEA
tara:strand:- start:16124 stop:16477 length:354 start_codon:yes stop_codon:yes gene_type:complete